MVGKTWATVSALAAVKNLEIGYTPENLKKLMKAHGINRKILATELGVDAQSVSAWRAPIGAAMHRDMNTKNWRKFLQMRVETETIQVYSLDGDHFDHDPLDLISEQPDIESGVITLYVADRVPVSAGQLFKSYGIIDGITESAHELCGVDDYLDDLSADAESGLIESIGGAINKWADDHELQPKFYAIENVRRANYRVVVDDNGNLDDIVMIAWEYLK